MTARGVRGSGSQLSLGKRGIELGMALTLPEHTPPHTRSACVE